MNPPSETGDPQGRRIRDTVLSSVIVILTEPPDPESNILTLQDYQREAGSFIPIFRSKESFQQSTGGGVDKPIYQMNRRLFVGLLRGPETVILDAALPDEIVTTGHDLKRIFLEPFDLAGGTPNP